MYRPGVGGGNYQGRFAGRVKRPRPPKLYRGYAECVKFAGVARDNQCVYLGFTSISGISYSATNGPGYSRLLQDICVSILRVFFKSKYPGCVEFETPAQSLNALNISSYNFYYKSRQHSGGTATDTQLTIGPTTSLFDLAGVLAGTMTYQWSLGYLPMALFCSDSGATNGNPRGYMWLNNLIVSASCTNCITLQNQTLADDGAANDGDANTTIDVSANPIKGRMFYMRHLTPEVCVGYRLGDGVDVTNTDDLWGAINLRRAVEGTLFNVISPGISYSTGCWQVVPPAEYFKHVSGVKDISMEPGVQKSFKLRFHFNGSLTNFLRGEYSNFADVTTTATPAATLAGLSLQGGLKSGFGQCVLLALEKRLRQTGVQVVLAYQIDTYIRTNVRSTRQPMSYHVETNV